MKTCIYLSYKGLGANLLHLTYCHEIAKKYGPITIITLCGNLEAALKNDPIIEKVSSHYEDHLFHVWENLGRILHQNGLRGEIMRGAGFNDFLAFAENYMGVY